METKREEAFFPFQFYLISVRTAYQKLHSNTMDSRKTEYRFAWFLENYSYFRGRSGRWLNTPEFVYEGLERTSWVIGLSPYELRRQGGASLYLKRSPNDPGPANLSVNLNLSIMTADGSTLYSEEGEHTFKKGEELPFKAFVNMDELYLQKNTQFLPRDTLSVHCRLWRGDGSVEKVTHYTARTQFRIEKISFLHKMENFSSIKMDEEKILQLPFHSKTGCSFTSSLVLRNLYGGTIVGGISSSDDKYDLCKKKLRLIDASKNTIECFDLDYRFDGWRDEHYKILQTFTRQFILNNRAQYLPNDDLNLLYECLFSFEESRIEEILHDIPVATYMDIYNDALSKNDGKTSE